MGKEVVVFKAPRVFRLKGKSSWVPGFPPHLSCVLCCCIEAGGWVQLCALAPWCQIFSLR